MHLALDFAEKNEADVQLSVSLAVLELPVAIRTQLLILAANSQFPYFHLLCPFSIHPTQTWAKYQTLAFRLIYRELVS